MVLCYLSVGVYFWFDVKTYYYAAACVVSADRFLAFRKVKQALYLGEGFVFCNSDLVRRDHGHLAGENSLGVRASCERGGGSVSRDLS